MTESQQPIYATPPPRRARRHNPIWVIFLLMAAVLSVQRWLGPRERVPWGNDFAVAQLQARASKKPILANFTADWCGPCLNMSRNVWSDKQVAAAATAYVPIRIDVDIWPELKEKYRVNAIPTVAVMDEQGKVLRSLTGYHDPAEMIDWLSSSAR